MVNFYGLQGAIKEEEGITMYPSMGMPYGEDALVNHSKDFNADISITWQDVHTMDMNWVNQLKRWIPWTPVDRDPMGSPLVDRLRSAHRIISCSKFGEEQIKNNGMYSTYIPCSVETSILKPPDFSKEDYRKSIGIPPDLFLFGMVSANKEIPPRKSFQEVLDAFALFKKQHPKSGIFFHINKIQGYAFPIGEYAKFLGLEKDIFYLDDYKQMYKVKDFDMAGFYSMMDCLLLPSSAEGFGMPAVEAQSCGTPVIVNRFTSMPELVIEGKTGFVCEVAIKQFSPTMGYVGIPSVKSLYDQMEKMIRANRKQMALDARRHVVDTYDADLIFNTKWLPYLSNIERHIYPQG
jgi:glycosyltransferase involved in cell wall biosynthesis